MSRYVVEVEFFKRAADSSATAKTFLPAIGEYGALATFESISAASDATLFGNLRQALIELNDSDDAYDFQVANLCGAKVFGLVEVDV